MDSTERIAYRLDEAAAAIGVSVQTVRRWASRDGLPVYQRGRVQLVFHTDLIAFVRAAPAPAAGGRIGSTRGRPIRE